MVRVGIIGFGYWGPNLVRNFIQQANCKFLQIADLNPQRLSIAKKLYPELSTTSDFNELINNPEIDAVIIATPVFTHHRLALQALQNGKHLMIEKPMTSSLAEAEELREVAAKKGLVVMVDHTFLYTGAVQKIKEIIKSGSIGKPMYFDSTRINLGLFQPDINVLWDLAPHDLSILLHLIDEEPMSVNATGISHTGNGIENIAYMTVNFQSGFIAHFNCSWSSPVKVRSTLIGGDKKMIFYNDLEPTEKVKIYDSSYNVMLKNENNSILVDYRIGDIYVPKIPTSEALSGVANDFLNSIMNSTTPLADSALGCEVVKILEASQQSIKNNGKEVLIG
jgi:predicted dehydrogenase